MIYTADPGLSRPDLGSNSPPDPDVFDTRPRRLDPAGRGRRRCSDQQRSRWRPRKTGYRYYLVWITALPPRQMLAALNEVALYKLTR